MNKDRLIELLLEEVEAFWFVEMTTQISDEKMEELDALIEEYKLKQP